MLNEKEACAREATVAGPWRSAQPRCSFAYNQTRLSKAGSSGSAGGSVRRGSSCPPRECNGVGGVTGMATVAERSLLLQLLLSLPQPVLPRPHGAMALGRLDLRHGAWALGTLIIGSRFRRLVLMLVPL